MFASPAVWTSGLWLLSQVVLMQGAFFFLPPAGFCVQEESATPKRDRFAAESAIPFRHNDFATLGDSKLTELVDLRSNEHFLFAAWERCWRRGVESADPEDCKNQVFEFADFMENELGVSIPAYFKNWLRAVRFDKDELHTNDWLEDRRYREPRFHEILPFSNLEIAEPFKLEKVDSVWKIIGPDGELPFKGFDERTLTFRQDSVCFNLEHCRLVVYRHDVESWFVVVMSHVRPYIICLNRDASLRWSSRIPILANYKGMYATGWSPEFVELRSTENCVVVFGVTRDRYLQGLDILTGYPRYWFSLRMWEDK